MVGGLVRKWRVDVDVLDKHSHILDSALPGVKIRSLVHGLDGKVDTVIHVAIEKAGGINGSGYRVKVNSPRH